MQPTLPRMSDPPAGDSANGDPGAQVVAKSTKLLPTMVIGSLLLGRRFNSWHYAAALCLCAGLGGFALSDSHASGSATTSFGVLLLG